MQPRIRRRLKRGAGCCESRSRSRPFLPGTFTALLEGPLVAVTIALFSYSVAKFRAASTPEAARKPSAAIIRAGPHRFSQNPIDRAAPGTEIQRAVPVEYPVCSHNAFRYGTGELRGCRTFGFPTCVCAIRFWSTLYCDA